MPGVSSFFINVPQIDPSPPNNETSLMLLSVFIDLEEDREVTFRVTSPNPTTNFHSPLIVGPYGPSTAGNPQNSQINGLQFGTPNVGNELDVVLPANTGASNDPQRRRYQFFLNLFADYDKATCRNTNFPLGVTTEQWLIEIVNNADVMPKTAIAGAGVLGYTQPNCDSIYQPVVTPGKAASVGIIQSCTLTNGSTAVTTASKAHLTAGMRVSGTGIPAGTTIAAIGSLPTVFTLSSPATITATENLQFTEVVEGVESATILGLSLRLGVDAVLVLDRSGSMASPAIDGQPTPARITELQQSFAEFSKVWAALRTSEGTPPPDNIGVTIFDDVIEWWSGIPNPPTHLNAFNTSLSTTIQANVNTITARNLTSIGGGLLQADGALTGVDATRRRVILLMSDGLQNTDPMVGVVNNSVVTYSQLTPNNTTPLPNQANYQIYTVTVGPSNLVNAQINQQIAQTANGFYTNSENDATILDQFFLEILQNFVHFSSWETFRLIQAQLTAAAPTFTTTVPVSTTTTNVSVALRAIRAGDRLQLSVTPPGEKTPTHATTDDGTAVLNFRVPTSAAYQRLGRWTIVVDVAPASIPPILLARTDASTGGQGAATFSLTVLGDDKGLRGELTIVPGDYIPGQPIQLEARLFQLGKLAKGLGGHSGDQLVAEVIKPGVGVGDLLSDSTAPTTQPFRTDPMNSAQAKLHNQLQASPASLNRITGDVVTLTDDGTGVYQGSYSVETPGHYNFLFGIESGTTNVGRFSRQQLKTVYVRAKPDGAATDIQSSTQTVSLGNQLSLTFTPSTRFGNRLGPGWANYFWFTAPGVRPFKGVDNLNGSYTARLIYHTSRPPAVALNFIDVPVIIGDETPPENLPVRLGPGTILTPLRDDVPYIGTWLVLGPIFDPRHQPGPEPGGSSRPTAAQIIREIDHLHDQLNPAALTADPAHGGPSHGDIVRSYGGTLMAARPYEWRQRYFAGMDWNDVADVRDDIHEHLVGDYGADEFDAYNYLNFAGKRHALVFLLAYIISPNERATRIAFRHADSLRAWLNGIEIRKTNELPFIGDHTIADRSETTAAINLRRGPNILLAAMAVTRAEWGFSTRIEDYQGLVITAERPNKDPIAPFTSSYQFVGVAGDRRDSHPIELHRALFSNGNKIWRGRVRIADENLKIVAVSRSLGQHTPGLYDIIFNEDDPAHPIFILVKPFSQ